jgi:hypothetical protein
MVPPQIGPLINILVSVMLVSQYRLPISCKSLQIARPSVLDSLKLSLIRTWDAAQWTTESFFASQNVSLCPGSTYSFGIYYYIQGVAGTCQLQALLDGNVFATSVDWGYDFSGPRPFDLFSGSVVATAETQTLMIKPSCPPGTYFNIFFDNITLTLGAGQELPAVIQGVS